MSFTLARHLALLTLCCAMTISVPAQDDFFLDETDCDDDDDIDDDDRRIEAELVGLCEVPSISTPGRGLFTAEIDANGSSISWTLRYRDLEAPAEQAHIHLGQEHTNGGVIAFLCSDTGDGGAQACPDGAASFSGTITAAQVVGPAEQGIAAGELAELLGAIYAGAAYVNVHSTKYPMGEIRGQIVEDDDDDDDD